MTRYIDQDEALRWRKAVGEVAEAQQALSKAFTTLVIDLGMTGGLALDLIVQAERALSGLPYMMTPQPEWTGGGIDAPGDGYKLRAPHITTIDQKGQP